MRAMVVIALSATLIRSAGTEQARSVTADPLWMLLHSPVLHEQRQALNEILAHRQAHVPQLQQLLRTFPALVQTDWQAAHRAVYAAALLRDPSFAPILASELGDPAVVAHCEYGCSVVFALTVYGCFGGWQRPPDLDRTLTTVYDLDAHIQLLRRPGWRPSSPAELFRAQPKKLAIWEKMGNPTVEQLIRIVAQVGPDRTKPAEWDVALLSLPAATTTSRNRLDLYLLAMNDYQYDASGYYRGAIYQAIYRAELAKADGR